MMLENVFQRFEFGGLRKVAFNLRVSFPGCEDDVGEGDVTDGGGGTLSSESFFLFGAFDVFFLIYVTQIGIV